jgi:single-stranded DNA-binding protein
MVSIKIVRNGEATDIVTIKGNLTSAPKLTAGGMCFLQVAWERPTDKKDENGRWIPTFVSVKAFGLDAQALVTQLGKGDRVTISAARSIDRYPDNRSDELKAKYPRDGYEYKLQGIEVVKKSVVADQSDDIFADTEMLEADTALAEAPAPVKKSKKSKQA